MSADLAFRISPENIIEDFSDFESWSKGTSVAPDGWDAVGTAGSIARESTEIKYGTYSMKIISGASGQYAAEYTYDFLGRTLFQENRVITAVGFFPGRTITFGKWVKCSSASKARIYINDGFTTTNSSYHTGGGSYEFLTVTVQVNSSSTQLKFGCEVVSNTVTAYFDSGIVCVGEATFTEFRGSNIYVREVDWDASVTFALGSFSIPRRDGTQVGAVTIKEGKLRLKVQIHSTDFPTARAIYDTIIKAVSDGQKDIRFADDRVIKAHLNNLPVLNLNAAALVYVFELQFIVPRGTSRYLSALRNKQSITSSPTSYNFSVIGNYKTFPTFYFLSPTGITLSTISLENLTTGERFNYSTNVPPGGTLMINCDEGTVLLNGVDGGSYFSGDFLKLIPGTNYLKYTGTTGLTLYSDYFNTFL